MVWEDTNSGSHGTLCASRGASPTYAVEARKGVTLFTLRVRKKINPRLMRFIRMKQETQNRMDAQLERDKWILALWGLVG